MSTPKSARPGSLAHAAKRLGVTPPTIYKLIRDGKLRTFHIGRAHRVTDVAIDDCIATLEQQNATRRAPAAQMVPS